MQSKKLSKKAQQALRKRAEKQFLEESGRTGVKIDPKKPLLGVIDASAFRSVNSNYADFYYQQKKNYMKENPGAVFSENYAVEGLSGYVDLIPQAPGFCASIMSPNYPILYARDITIDKLKSIKQVPILRIASQKDIDMLCLLKIITDGKAISEDLNGFRKENKELWLLPDQKVIAVPSKCKNLQDVMQSEQQNKNELNETQNETNPLFQEQNYKKIKKLFISTVVAVIVLLVAYFYIEEKYFDNTVVISNKYNIKQHYDVLGLKQNVKLAELKSHYRKIALKLHPDRNPDCQDCREKFDRITKAYKSIIEIQYHEQYIPTVLDKQEKAQQPQK